MIKAITSDNNPNYNQGQRIMSTKKGRLINLPLFNSWRSGINPES
jgi:hypothetical protein